MTRITDYAPAKLNLFLDVTSKRANGYHEVDSVMQTISLCDVINMEIDNGNRVEGYCASSFAPNGKDNIVWRAADAYLKENKIEAYVKIELEKNIPSPAGMGGGSSDAATVLRMLNGYFKAMNYGELIELALKIGSDVPFCVKGGTQRVRGLGEKLDILKEMPQCTFVIAVSGEDVATPAAYKTLDSMYGSFKTYEPDHRPDLLLNGLEDEKLNSICLNMYNIFENAVLPACPVALKSKEFLAQNGAINSMMSGSGATVFGIFEDQDEAKSVAERLSALDVKVFVEHPYYIR